MLPISTIQWTLLIQGISEPVFLMRPGSFVLVGSNVSAAWLFGLTCIPDGTSIEDLIPAELASAVKSFWDTGSAVSGLIISWTRIAEVVHLEVDVNGVTDQNHKGEWMLRIRRLSGTPLNTSSTWAKLNEAKPRRRSTDESDIYAAAQMEFNLQRATSAVRAQIGADLHDSLGQELTVAQLSLDLLMNTLAEYQPLLPTGNGLADIGTSLSRQLAELAMTSRRIAFGLRPIALLGNGFAESISELVRGFSVKTGIPGSFAVEADWIDPSEAHMAHLYKCVQEMLTNIGKHSKATRFKVHLGLDNLAGLAVEVSDNGVGVPLELIENKALNWYSLKTHASAMQGKFSFRSRPEVEGTFIKITCPF